jgi:hypothetical protein
MLFPRRRREGEMVAVLLAPGDLIVLAGSARHGWTHEISRERAKEQVWAGKVLEQARRISVTLRRLCPKENVHYMESWAVYANYVWNFSVIWKWIEFWIAPLEFKVREHCAPIFSIIGLTDEIHFGILVMRKTLNLGAFYRISVGLHFMIRVRSFWSWLLQLIACCFCRSFGRHILQRVGKEKAHVSQFKIHAPSHKLAWSNSSTQLPQPEFNLATRKWISKRIHFHLCHIKVSLQLQKLNLMPEGTCILKCGASSPCSRRQACKRGTKKKIYLTAVSSPVLPCKQALIQCHMCKFMNHLRVESTFLSQVHETWWSMQ